MMMRSRGFLEHPVFKEAVSDLGILGVEVSDRPRMGAVPYAVIGGRSNARWWLVPLENRNVTNSSLALFQPILPSARWMKWGASKLSSWGMAGLWAKSKVYVRGKPRFEDYFGEEGLSFAYFTGTDSPHRKVAIQIMNERGDIKGFAKLTRSACVANLLEHEAEMLQRVRNRAFQTANFPSTLFSGVQNGARMLITDTLKTPKTKTVTKLRPQHMEFLQEMAQKTAGGSNSSIVSALKQNYEAIERRLTPEWRQRFEKGIARLEVVKQYLLPPTLTHGDFTPWNTFIVGRKLYVFDWEYAETNYPASNDFVNFLLSTSYSRNQSAEQRVRELRRKVADLYEIDDTIADEHLVIYLLSRTLLYAERANLDEEGRVCLGDEKSIAELIDFVLANSS